MGKSVTGIIRLKDEASSTLNNVRSANNKLRNDTKNTFQELKKTFDHPWKAKLDASSAMQNLRQIKSDMNGLKNGFKCKIGIKDNASKEISNIRNKLNILGKTIVSPFVKLKDATTSKLKTLKKDVLNLDGMKAKISSFFSDHSSGGMEKAKSNALSLAKIGKIVITLAVAGAGLQALQSAVSSGMQLETQQVSIKHFIGATNKDLDQSQIDVAAKEFTDALRNNANATPFETGEVIQAGSRAIAITQGNRSDAMSLVQLAEDMAAASGGTKNVSDAMEALADAKLGEMERLKEFGFKVSADEFEQKGFSGVSKDLQEFYGGAATKLASTGSGLLSTIKGKLKSGIADFGLKVVEQLKPVFTDIIGFIDKAMPFLEKFGSAFADTIGNGIKFVSEKIPKLVAGFQKFQPYIDAIAGNIKAMIPPIMAFAGTVGSAISGIVAVAIPVISQIIAAIAQVLPVVEPIFSTIIDTISMIVQAVLPPLGAAFSVAADVICACVEPIASTFEALKAQVQNVIDGITSIFQGGMDLFKSIWDGNWQGVVDSFSTIFGGILDLGKVPINGVIGFINKVIDAINAISVDLPDWLPGGLGGKHIGFDLGHISYLAKGGVVDKPTPAIFGEAGKEAVMPLERNTGWISQLAGNISAILQPASIPATQNGNTTFSSMLKYLGDGLNQIQMAFKNQPIPLAALSSGDTSHKPSGSKKVEVNMETTIIVNKEADIDDVGEKILKKLKKAIDNV